MLTVENKKNFTWNSMGVGLNAFLSPLFLMIVSRVMGIREAGFFALAFATSVLLSNIGLYNTRNYQITDVRGSHSDSVYLNARMVTALFMVIAVASYSLTKLANPSLFWDLLLLGIWRVPETISDVMHGTLQMNHRLDLVGKSLLLRGILCIIVFAASVCLTHNLVLAGILLICVNFVVLFFYDLRNYRKINPTHKTRLNYLVKDLLVICFPLFLISLLYSFFINAQRYSIDIFGTPEIQTVYSIIILPASMIWVIFTMVLNPILPHLSELHYQRNFREFVRKILWLIGAVFIFCIIYIAFMYFIGIQIFGAIYNVPLQTHRLEFVLVGMGSGVLCIATIFSNLLIIIRETKILLICYTTSAVLAALSGVYFVIHAGLLGATLSYLFMMLVLLTLLAVGYVFAERRARNTKTAGV